MKLKLKQQTTTTVGSRSAVNSNEERIEYAKSSLDEMAHQAICGRQSGTIGVEISLKEGKLGKVKRLLIDFQQG
jgi:hypothetical protein